MLDLEVAVLEMVTHWLAMLDLEIVTHYHSYIC